MKTLFVVLSFIFSTGAFAAFFGASGSNATQLQGVGVTNSAPATNQCLVYGGSAWGPATCGGNSFQVGQFVSTTSPLNVPSIFFSGTNTGASGLPGLTTTAPNTGLDAVTADIGTFVEFYANGYFLMDAGVLGGSNRGTLSVAMDIIPDPADRNYTLGNETHPWPLITTGAISNIGGNHTRQIYLKAGGYGSNVVGYGIDMSDNYGAAYFRAFDDVTQVAVDNVWSVKSSNKAVTQTFGDATTGSTAGFSGTITPNTTVNGSGGTLTIQGANASGSGTGGNVVLQGGTSGSGTAGVVQIGRSSTTNQNILNNATAAASNCGSIAGAAGCLQMTINGTTHYVPYF
jgi:hypothetical protein